MTRSFIRRILSAVLIGTAIFMFASCSGGGSASDSASTLSLSLNKEGGRGVARGVLSEWGDGATVAVEIRGDFDYSGEATVSNGKATLVVEDVPKGAVVNIIVGISGGPGTYFAGKKNYKVTAGNNKVSLTLITPSCTAQTVMDGAATSPVTFSVNGEIPGEFCTWIIQDSDPLMTGSNVSFTKTGNPCTLTHAECGSHGFSFGAGPEHGVMTSFKITAGSVSSTYGGPTFLLSN